MLWTTDFTEHSTWHRGSPGSGVLPQSHDRYSLQALLQFYNIHQESNDVTHGAIARHGI
jgi:hypothetical protein